MDRSYSYDNLDRLVSKKHNRQGQSDYRYHVTGRIESCRNESYWETLQYDAAANLLDRRRGEEESNQNLIRFNQLLSFRGLKYSYDEHGRTRSKQTASGTQYYHYDAEHRLTEVRIEQLTILNATATSTMPSAGGLKNTGWTVTASHATAPPSCGTGCR